MIYSLVKEIIIVSKIGQQMVGNVDIVLLMPTVERYSRRCLVV